MKSLIQLLILLILSMFAVAADALDCNGHFEITASNNKYMQKWTYKKQNYNLSGETWSHKKQKEFTLKVNDTNVCNKNELCDVSQLLCGVSSALSKVEHGDLKKGRIIVKSLELYQYAKPNISVDNCPELYVSYQSNLENFWLYWIEKLSKHFQYYSLHQREIKVEKPTSLEGLCFPQNNKSEIQSWHDIDFYPVVTVIASDKNHK